MIWPIMLREHAGLLLIILFIEKEVDKRSRLYKAVKAKGHIVELTVQDENTLRRWVLESL